MTHDSLGTLAVVAAVFLLPLQAFPQQRNSDIQNIGTRDINTGGLRLRVASPEAETAMGRELAQMFEQQVTLLTDTTIVDYVNRVAKNIVLNSDAATIPFTTKVIDSAEINAVGLPGGFLYVNTGLIQTADNEAQLAAMISHVVAHVAARHAAEQQGRADFINILSLPSTTFPGTGQSQAISTAIPAMFAKFSRDAEEEADFLGLQYLYKAGYDPNAMAAFFQKIATQEASTRRVSTLFSTHPPTADRAVKSTDNIRTYLPARQQNLVTTPEFDAVKARLLAR